MRGLRKLGRGLPGKKTPKVHFEHLAVEKIVDRKAKRSDSGAFSMLAKPRRILLENVRHLFS